MGTRDYLIIGTAPAALLLLPLAGQLTVDGWNWTWHDFAFAWAAFTVGIGLFRFLVTRPAANFAYKAGVALAILAGFLMSWITLAVRIIGDDNTGNGLYLLTIVGGFIGIFVTRSNPARLSRVAFAMAAALLLIPGVAALAWPEDFSPGYLRVQMLSAGFATLFVIAGFSLRRATDQKNRAANARGD